MAGVFGKARGGGRGACRALLVLVCSLPGAGSAGAQLRAQPRAYPGVDAQGGVGTLEAAVRTMAGQADVIFLGTVERVTRLGSGSGEDPAEAGFGGAGTVEVEFRVEQAVRGVTGASYTLREWGGLWPAGEQRYGVGERRLMLLHRPGALGLSSPVGGMDGAIPVRGDGARVSRSSTTATVAQGAADLRWIAAKLLRPLQYAAASTPMRAPVARDEEPMAERAAGMLRPHTVVERESQPTLVHGVVTRPVVGGFPEPATDGSAVAMPVADLLVWLRGWQAEAPGVR